MAKTLPIIKKTKEQNKMFDEQITLTFFEDSQEYEIKLYPFYSNTRINNIIQQFGDDLKAWDELGIKVSDELLFPLIVYEVIKGSSNLRFPKNPKTDIQFFQEFINTTYFTEIVDAMIEDEVAKVFDKLQEMQLANEKLERQLKKFQDDVQNLDLKNPELIERLQPNKKKQIPEV